MNFNLRGIEAHANHSSASGTTKAKATLTRQDDMSAITLAANDYIALTSMYVYAVATGDVKIFFDIASLASAVAVAAVSTGSHTFTIAGDRAVEFAAGRTFSVSGSTGNDGSYTTSGASYSATTGNTTITVTAGPASAVADGTITSDIVARSSNIIFSGTVAANTGIAGMFYADHNGRRGPDGHAIYVLPTNGQFDVNMECLIKRKTSYDAVVR